MIVAAALTGAPAFGNDSTFGGAGADLVPLVQSDVAMRAEDIRLTARASSWHVRARYVFFNHATKTVTVQVGFPEYRCEKEGDCRGTAFRNLVTKVGGQTVTHRSGNLDRRHEWASYLGTVWLFDVTFPPGQELVIEHDYSLPSGSDVWSNQFTTYVTRTGASWKGSIGHARFTAILPPYTHTVSHPAVAGAQVHPPQLLLDGTPRVELVIEAKDWTPKGEVHLSFNGSAYIAEARLPAARAAWAKSKVAFDTLFRPSACAGQSAQAGGTPQDCKNLIYASKGYTFQNQTLATRYYGAPSEFQLVKTELADRGYWVRGLRALAGFSVNDFSEGERNWLRQLEEGGIETMPSLVGKPLGESPPIEPPPVAPVASVAASKAKATTPGGACGCRAVGARSELGGASWLVGCLLLLASAGRRQQQLQARA